MRVIRKGIICSCHNDSYTKEYTYCDKTKRSKPVWQCVNCSEFTNRRTKAVKAQLR